jgi:hypothetical protein
MQFRRQSCGWAADWVAVQLLFSSPHFVAAFSPAPQRRFGLPPVHLSVANGSFVLEYAQIHRFAPRLEAAEALSLYKMTRTRGRDRSQLALYILEAT